MTNVSIVKNGRVINSWVDDDSDARRTAIAVANSQGHHIKEYFESIVAYDGFGKEVLKVEMRKIVEEKEDEFDGLLPGDY